VTQRPAFIPVPLFRFLFSLLLWLAATNASAMTSVPYGGVLAGHSAKCLTVEGGSTQAGARILQGGCTHAGGAQWLLRTSGSDANTFQLVDQASGLCLAVSTAAPVAGAQVIQATCGTDTTMLWSMTAQGTGWQLQVKSSAMCLDVYGASLADGASLVQWNCNQQSDETFVFERALFTRQAPTSIMGLASGMCTNVSGGATAPGSPLVQWPCSGAGNDTWTLQVTGASTVQVVGKQSQLCMAVKNGSTSAGAAIVLQACSGKKAASTQWQLQPYGGAWRLVGTASGMCLNVSGGNLAAGRALIQWPCQGGSNELWTLHVPTPVARWSGVTPTTIDAVAAAHLPDGRILTWSAEAPLGFGGGPTGQTYTEIVDPVGGTDSVYLVTNTQHDMFCPGTAMLADGRVLVNGGIDSPRTSIYDPSLGDWSVGGDMNVGRGYQGTVPLPDGSVFTLGGSWSGGVGGKTGERWTAGTGWALLSGVPETKVQTGDVQGTYRADNHLWLQVLSGGRLLHAGPSKQMNWIDVFAGGGAGSIISAGLRGDDADSMNGNASAYDVDHVLKVGGSRSYGYGTTGFNATNSAQVIDGSGGTLSVTRVAPMTYARAFGNSVVLPTGQVVVVGGQSFALPFSDDNAIYVPEIWDPVTRVFERLPAMATPRTYHSVALMLLDGRIWVSGGGLCGSCATNHANYEILTPPYLLNADGSFASRPAITALGSTVVPLGGTLSVATSTPVSSFALVRMSSVTHTVNNDQRRIPLAGTTTDGANYVLTLPSDPGVAVPGQYMLFAMNALGVPSVAQVLRVSN